METTETYISQIRQLIAKDDLLAALQLLQEFQQGSPYLSEIIHQSGRFQYIRKQFRLDMVSFEDATVTQNHIRFGLLDLLLEIEQNGKVTLPLELARSLVNDDVNWVKNLRRAFLKEEVSVKNDSVKTIEHFGWLIEESLRKLLTPPGRKRTLKRLSYMAEAFQNSLRYLCYIQMSQILKLDPKPNHPLIEEMLEMKEDEFIRFDYFNLLLVTTDILRGKSPFIPDIESCIDEIYQTNSKLYAVTIFLHNKRFLLLENKIAEDHSFGQMLNEYLTALVYWLSRISFLARYRLISMKDIVLNYRIGTAKNFVHIYGELNGLYRILPEEERNDLVEEKDVNAIDEDSINEKEEYTTKTIKNAYTYNHSVLLFKGKTVETCMDNIGKKGSYISLTPFIIDKSVLDEKPKQTPEIYYFIGSDSYEYYYAKYQNELTQKKGKKRNPNKYFKVKDINEGNPRSDELYEHIEDVFSPLKSNAL